MKIVITATLALFSYGLYAQNNSVEITFVVNEKKMKNKNAFVQFIKAKDSAYVGMEAGVLNIPLQFYRKNATIIFHIGKYSLAFDSIPLTINELNRKWTVGVDKKPFNKKKHWGIKDWEKIKVVYYFDNEDGRNFTIRVYEKSKIKRKKNVFDSVLK